MSDELLANHKTDREHEGVLRATGLRKAFLGTVALAEVDIELHRGEIVAVVGENGAGKSTLKNLLVGVLSPDKGEVLVRGTLLTRQNAVHLGVSAVHQEFSLFPSLTVAENICIRDLPTKRSVVDWNEVRRIAKDKLDAIGAAIDVRNRVETLSAGEQQLVEIAKALTLATNVLVLDEPTTSLTEPERERLFEVLRRLRDSGLSMIFISHFIEEVYEIADRVVVLRDGKQVGNGRVENFAKSDLESLMVGRPIEEGVRVGRRISNEVALRLEGLTDFTKLTRISLELYQGEILGLAGLMGAGRTELLETIWGVRPGSGKVTVFGEVIPTGDSVRLKQLGVSFVPEDRRRHSLFEVRSLQDNISAAQPRFFSHGRVLGFGFRGEKTAVSKVLRDFGVRHPGQGEPIQFLSGGNQQKATIARWLSMDPRICFLDEPTRGVDIGAKEDIHRMIVKLASRGTSVLLASSELNELIALCHRILVMRNGSVVAELPQEHFSAVEIIRHAASGEGSNNADRH